MITSRRIYDDENGSIVLLWALLLSLLIGFIGVGAEVSAWYRQKSDLQKAADAAAIAAANSLDVNACGQTTSAAQQTCVRMVIKESITANGFGPQAGGQQLYGGVGIQNPYMGRDDQVQVCISLTESRLFSAISEGTGFITINTCAAAQYGGSSGGVPLSLYSNHAMSMGTTFWNQSLGAVSLNNSGAWESDTSTWAYAGQPFTSTAQTAFFGGGGCSNCSPALQPIANTKIITVDPLNPSANYQDDSYYSGMVPPSVPTPPAFTWPSAWSTANCTNIADIAGSPGSYAYPKYVLNSNWYTVSVNGGAPVPVSYPAPGTFGSTGQVWCGYITVVDGATVTLAAATYLNDASGGGTAMITVGQGGSQPTTATISPGALVPGTVAIQVNTNGHLILNPGSYSGIWFSGVNTDASVDMIPPSTTNTSPFNAPSPGNYYLMGVGSINGFALNGLIAGTVNAAPGFYIGIGSVSNVNFYPGTYVITPLGSTSGNGIYGVSMNSIPYTDPVSRITTPAGNTFFFAGSGLSSYIWTLAAAQTVNLTAPSSGPYRGLLFYSPVPLTSLFFSAGNPMNLQGTIYLAGGGNNNLTLASSTVSDMCLQLDGPLITSQPLNLDPVNSPKCAPFNYPQIKVQGDGGAKLIQ